MIATNATFEWDLKRALTLTQARRRSRVIAVLRSMFVAGAGASLAVAFVFASLGPADGRWTAPPQVAAEPPRLINARFLGHSERGPYELTADIAEQRGEDQPIELTAPVYRSAGTMLQAPHGVYDERTNSIVFDGDVVIAERGGHSFTMPSVTIDLERGALAGSGGVTGVSARAPD